LKAKIAIVSNPAFGTISKSTIEGGDNALGMFIHKDLEQLAGDADAAFSWIEVSTERDLKIASVRENYMLQKTNIDLQKTMNAASEATLRLTRLTVVLTIVLLVLTIEQIFPGTWKHIWKSIDHWWNDLRW
jgi:hypothetical protein